MVTRRLLPALAFAIAAVLGASSLGAQVPPACVNCTAYAVQVTPVDTTLGFAQNAGNKTIVFKVKNIGLNADTYTFTCSHTGGEGCVSVVPSSGSLDVNDSISVTVTYSVGASSGNVVLTAASSHTSAFGTLHVVISPTVTLVVPVLTSGSRALVHNRQPIIRALFTPNGTGVDTTRTTFTWRGSSVMTLARANRGLVEWEVDSTHWLGVADSGQVVISACATGGNCTTVSRWAVLAFDSTAVLGFSGMPVEALGRTFGTPFGPGLGISDAEVETGIGTPPYFSMGVARSAGLVYSTRQSYPRALVPVDLELTWPVGAPDQVKVILSDGATKLDSVVVATPSCTSWNSGIRRCRTVLQGDFSGMSSGFARKWLTIEARVTSGATTKISTDSVEVVLVDRRTTPYGSGWWPTGVLKLVAAGSDRLLVGSSGTVAVYRGIGDSVYISPPGDFSILKKVGSTWELSPRGSTAKLVFDANGRLVKALDANSNKDSIVYRLSTDTVTSFIDPVGKTITVAYDANGHISTFSDPGSRQTKVTVNNSTLQLTYDSISSPTTRPYTSRFVYQAYGTSASGTLVLTKRIGVIKDTTEAVYDSSFKRRPVQAKLPRVPNEVGDSSALPTVSYLAVEQRGFGSLVSLESTYVGVTDARGNWTRSLLNRWGQARKTWDALDSIGRTEYSPDGFVLWSRGKTGDSSRVNNVYDAQGLGHLVATYMKRSSADSLRLDSLVYDSNHRVIKRLDSGGHAWQTAYDGNGNVASTTSPTGDVTQFWYKTSGSVDSTRAPADSTSTIFTYDATWKNLATVTDPGGDLVVTNNYDSFGRLYLADSKIRVRVTATSTLWQWREQESFLNIANQTDSSRVQRTDDCAAPCGDPNWPLNPDTDTLRVQRVRFAYDRAGRDSLRIDDRRDSTQYVYDRLGRLIRRRPLIGTSSVRDSFAYDLAGNVRRTFTRRGDLIAAAFDSRNRMTQDTIPGVGILQKTYGGPLDQLTRAAYANVVDSIGAVTATLTWGYDKSGRLKVDTSFTGTQARVTTYAYDTFERPSTSTDPLGTWTTRYDAPGGLVDTLLTPMNDTISFAYDNQWRLRTRKINGGGPAHTLNPRYGTAGDVATVTQTVATTPAFTAAKYNRVLFVDSSGPALLPVVTAQEGSGKSMDSLSDSITYDGWQHVTAVVSYRDTTQLQLVARDTFGFDRMGNIKTTAGGEVYDPSTTRLTAHAGSGCTWSYTYDQSGNLTQAVCGGTTLTYQYDALDQLRSVRLGATLIARYTYDVLGRRIAKRVYSSATGGSVGYTRFIYHGGNVAFEMDSIATTIGLRYTWASTDQLLAVDNGTNHYYVVTDKLGSVRALVRRDGTWIMTQRFGPYGAVITKDTNTNAGTSPGFAVRYGWTGREYDPETGFYFFRSRYYDLTVRRFEQEDAVGYAGSSNLYAYVDGDVMESTDPAGTSASAWYYYQQGLVAQLEGLTNSRYFTPACYLDGIASRNCAELVGSTGVTVAGVIDPEGEWADFSWSIQLIKNELRRAGADSRFGVYSYYRIVDAVHFSDYTAAYQGSIEALVNGMLASGMIGIDDPGEGVAGSTANAAPYPIKVNVRFITNGTGDFSFDELRSTIAHELFHYFRDQVMTYVDPTKDPAGALKQHFYEDWRADCFAESVTHRVSSWSQPDCSYVWPGYQFKR